MLLLHIHGIKQLGNYYNLKSKFEMKGLTIQTEMYACQVSDIRSAKNAKYF